MNNCPFEQCNFLYNNLYDLYDHIKLEHNLYSICGRCLYNYYDNNKNNNINILLKTNLIEDTLFEYICTECDNYLFDLENN